VLETLPPSAFFQDANYHDQIVKEQNKPVAYHCRGMPSARDPASRSQERHGQRFISRATHRATGETGLNPWQKAERLSLSHEIVAGTDRRKTVIGRTIEEN